MAIAYSGIGTAVTGSGVNPVLAPVAPASTTASRNYLAVTWKDGTIATPVVSASVGTWTFLGSQLQSGVATGLDVGSPNTAVWYADGAAPTTNSVTFTGTVGVCQAAIVNITKGASEFFTHDFAVGADSTNGANISATTNALFTDSSVSSIMLAISGANSDGGTPSSVAITNTNTVTNRLDSASVTGDDSRLSIWTAAPLTVGSEAKTFSYTNASSSSASVVLINIYVHRIQFNVAGTAATGSGANPVLAPGLPASSGSGYRNYLFIAWKESDENEPVVDSTTGDWIRATTRANTTFVATGADVGSMRSVLYYADGTCPTGTSVTFIGTIASAQAVIVNFRNFNTSETLIGHKFSTGEDDANGANYSATGDTNLLLVEDSVLIGFTGTNSDAGTPSAQAYTATSCTVGAVQGNFFLGQTTTGDDNAIVINGAAVSSGTSSTAATYTHTNASASKGVTIFVKLYLIALPTIVVTPLTDFYQNPGYTIQVDSISGFEYIEVLRSDEAGEENIPVRGGQYQSIGNNTTLITEDYEFRFGTTGFAAPRNELTYNVNFYLNGVISHTLASAPRSGITDWVASSDVDVAGAIPDYALPKTFISIPQVPSLNIPVNMQEFDTAAYDGNALSKSRVLGRRNPVVSMDVSTGKTGEFTLVIVYNPYSSGISGIPYLVREYEDLFSTGNTFMMRNIAPILVGHDDFYFIIDNYKITRDSRIVDQTIVTDMNRADELGVIDPDVLPVVSIDVTFTETDAPPKGATVSQFTWQALFDNFASWQEINDTFTTWLEVLQTSDGNF